LTLAEHQKREIKEKVTLVKQGKANGDETCQQNWPWEKIT